MMLLETIVADKDYCQHCQVIPIQSGDKYCDGCANELVNALYAMSIKD